MALFAATPRAVWLEIGFGGGEHLAALAAAHPEVGLLGVEPFINGVAKLLRAIEDRGLGNVRILMDDARLLLKALPGDSIERAFVLFPDPWPKLRHHKRRIVNTETVAELARVIRPGGELRLATDDPDYARWMLAAMLAERRFAWLAERAADWREPPGRLAADPLRGQGSGGRPPAGLSAVRAARSAPDAGAPTAKRLALRAGYRHIPATSSLGSACREWASARSPRAVVSVGTTSV